MRFLRPQTVSPAVPSSSAKRKRSGRRHDLIELLEQRRLFASSLVNIELAGLNQTAAYSGGAAAGGSGDRWNLVAGYGTSTTVTSSSLLNAAGAATNVSFTVGGATPGYTALGGTYSDSLVHNYATASSAYTVTLRGLNANTFYDLYLYGNDSSGKGASFSFPLGTAGGSAETTGNGAVFSGNPHYQQPGEYYGYTYGNRGNDIHSDSTGAIVITVAVPSGQIASVFNGLQIYGDFTSHGTILNAEIKGSTQVVAYSGAGAIGSNQDLWNLVSGYGFSKSATGSSLLDAAGDTTSVSVQISKGQPSFADAVGSVANTLIDQYASYGGSLSVTVTGLNPSTSYDLYLFGSNGGGALGGAFTITTGTTTAGTLSTTANGFDGNYTAGRDYVSFAGNSAVTSSSTGSIAFTVTGAGGSTSAVFNGLQIAGSYSPAVPASTAVNAAPSSFSTIGVGAGGYIGAPAISPTNPSVLSLVSDVGDTYYSSDTGKTWSNLNVYTDGGFQATNSHPLGFTNDPNIIYGLNAIGQVLYIGGTAYGQGYGVQSLYKSTNGGVTWTYPTLNGIQADKALGDVTADPNNSNNVFTVGYSNAKGGFVALNFSSDGGNNFQEVASLNGENGSLTASLPAHSPYTITVAGIYSSISGSTETIYLATNVGLIKGVGGTGSGNSYTWSFYGGSQAASLNGLPTSSGNGFSLFRVSGGTNGTTTTLYAALMANSVLTSYDEWRFTGNPYGTVYKLNPGDTSWTACSTNGISNDPIGSSGLVIQVTADPVDPTIAFASGRENDGTYVPRVWKTTNSGASWTDLITATNVFDGNIATGDDGAIRTGNMQNSPGNDFAWDYQAYATGLAISKTNPNELLMSTGWGVYKTVNGGADWTAVSVANPQAENTAGTSSQTGAAFVGTLNPTIPYDITFENANTMFVGYGDPGIARSDDRGTTWTVPAFPYQNKNTYGDTVPPNTVYATTYDAANHTLYAASVGLGGQHYLFTDQYNPLGNDSSGGVYYSTDDGKTWYVLGNYSSPQDGTAGQAGVASGADFERNTSDVALDPTNPNRLYATVATDELDGNNNPNRGGVYVTNDLNDGIASRWYRLALPMLAGGTTVANGRGGTVQVLPNGQIIFTNLYDPYLPNRAGVFLGTVTWTAGVPSVVWSDRTYTGNNDMRNQPFELTIDYKDDPSGNTWYLGTGNALFRTTTAGGTSGQEWTQLNNQSTWGAYINPWTGEMYVPTFFNGLYDLKPTSPGVYNFSNLLHDDAFPHTWATVVGFNPFINDGKIYVGSGGGGLWVGTETSTVVTSSPLVVNTLSDPASAVGGITSLREAVANAKALGGSQTITFASTLTGTITLTSPIIVSSNVTISGPAALNIAVQSNGNAGLEFATGVTGSISNLGLSSTSTVLQVDSSSQLSLSNVALAGSVAVQGLLSFDTGEQLNGLSIGAAGTVRVLHESSPLVVTTNALGITTGGTLDLASNDLVIHNTTATIANQTLTNVVGLLQSGLNTAQGYWNGAGIDSSWAATRGTQLTALGTILNKNQVTGNPLYASMDGQTGLSATDVLIRYTFFGDANLDGHVDGSDYTLIDYGYNIGATGWFNGDFNFDGIVDGSDYTMIDNAFNIQTPNALAATSVVASPATSGVSKVAVPLATTYAAPARQTPFSVVPVAQQLDGTDDSTFEQKLHPKKNAFALR